MERRRLPRVHSRFLVRLVGTEDTPKLRRGDISRSGVYVDLDRTVGEVGTVVRLEVTSPDGLATVSVLAQVVRVTTSQDLWKGAVCVGAAFQFILERPEQNEELDHLVRHLARPELATVPPAAQVDWQMDAELPAPPASPEPHAVIARLGPDEMLLDANWALEPGEVIRCEVQAPTSRRTIRLQGQVMSAVAQPSPDGTPRFRASVRFQDPLDQAPRTSPGMVGGSIDDAVAVLMDELLSIHAPDLPARQHLLGKLENVSLPVLLSFMERERMTGVLELRRDAQKAKLYVRDGQVVDVERDGRASPEAVRASLEALLQWTAGHFEFLRQAVDRGDRSGVRTAQLLMQLSGTNKPPA